MSPRTKNGVVTVCVIIGALIAQSIVQFNAISLMPAVLVLSLIATWTIEKPLATLLALGVFSELFTTQPFGVLLIVSVVPWIIFRLRGRIEPDVSFSFFLLLLLSVILQTAALLTPTIFSNRTTFSWSEILTNVIPWQHLSLSWFLVTVTVFFVTVFVPSFLPDRQSSIISLEGRRLG